MIDPTESVAIAHKDYDTRGGGEVFCRRLAELLDAPLVVGRRNQRNEPDADLDIREIPLSRPEKWMIDRGGLTRTAAYALRWPAGCQQLSEFDTVITSGNEPLWWVPDTEQTVIAYTHSTPRFMYDLFNETTNWGTAKGRLAALFYQVQRVAYESNVRRPDLWVANSEIVARRMERYWNLSPDQIRVVYPPVDTHAYDPAAAPTGDCYLYLGRLAGHKHVDEAVRAFAGRDSELIVAGTGPEQERLEAIAPPNVTFTGFVDEGRKRDLYARAKALVYPPASEDFGMVPVEAMASGTPVIGVDEGFTQYQIPDGQAGHLWERGELPAALDRFEREGVTWGPDRIAAFAASNWSIERFGEQMRAVIREARRETVVTTDLEHPAPEGDADPDHVHDTSAATDAWADLLADGGGDEP